MSNTRAGSDPTPAAQPALEPTASGRCRAIEIGTAPMAPRRGPRRPASRLRSGDACTPRGIARGAEAAALPSLRETTAKECNVSGAGRTPRADHERGVRPQLGHVGGLTPCPARWLHGVARGSAPKSSIVNLHPALWSLATSLSTMLVSRSKNAWKRWRKAWIRSGNFQGR